MASNCRGRNSRKRQVSSCQHPAFLDTNTMTAMDALRAFDSIPMMKEMSLTFNRAKRAAKPYVPFITRVLLVSAFVEDAFRTLLEYRSQLYFLKRELSIPTVLGFILIGASTTVTFIGSAMVFFKKAEKKGAILLLGAVIYQQIVYGRHSPITSGNFGFLVRNLCLIGTLMLIMTSRRIKDGLPALPGLPETGSKDSSRDNIALVTRFLVGLLCVEMFDVIGWTWAFIIIPICFSVLIGYKTDVMALLLTTFYTVATITSKQFWFIDETHAQAVFERDVMRFEFLQTISIMSGLVTLIMSGPGALSLDEKLKRGKKW